MVLEVPPRSPEIEDSSSSLSDGEKDDEDFVAFSTGSGDVPSHSSQNMATTNKRRPAVRAESELGAESMPAKKRRRLGASEPVGEDESLKMESSRLCRCRVIHHIESNYAQKDKIPPSIEHVAKELFQEGDWLIWTDNKLQPRTLRQLKSVIGNLLKQTGHNSKTFAAFCKNPVDSVSARALLEMGYEKYCRTVEQSVRSEVDPKLDPSLADAVGEALQDRKGKGLATSKPTSNSSSRSDAVLGQPGSAPPTPSRHQEDVLDQINTHSPRSSVDLIPDAEGALQQGQDLELQSVEALHQGSERLKSSQTNDPLHASEAHGISLGSGGRAVPSTELQSRSTSQPTDDPSGPHQHDLEMPDSRMVGPDSRITQGHFLCTKEDCTFDMWLSSSEVDQISRMVPSPSRPDEARQRQQIETEVTQRLRSEMDRIESEVKQRVESQVEERMKADEMNKLMPDATRAYFNTKSVARSFQNILSQIQSQLHQALVERGVANGQAAAFRLQPERNVQQLYEMITGNSSPVDSKIAIISDVSMEDLCISMFGAFLLCVVFGKSSGETFEGFQATSLGGSAETSAIATDIDHVLLDQHQTNYDTVLRKAYLHRLHDQTWVQKTFAHTADQLSEDFALRLEQHLNHENQAAGGKDNSMSVYRLSKRFYKIMLEALVLNCQISAGREKTTFLWYRWSQKFEAHLMEAALDGQQQVLLTTFPGLLLEADRPYPEVVFKAQVETG